MGVMKKMFGEMKNISRTRQTSGGGVRFDLFFDRQRVRSAMDRKEWRVLSRTGGFGRTYTRRSIKKAGKRKNKSSDPGDPPRWHQRGFVSLKDGIFFNADLDQGSVAIGASKLKTKVRSNRESGAQLQEEGGHGNVILYRHNKDRPGTWRKVRARWPERPFIEPSLIPTAKRKLELMKEVEL